MKELHEELRSLRNEKNISQSELAKYLGISQQAYSNYENNQREIPVKTVVALSKYYQISTDSLLGIESTGLGSTDLSSNYLGDTTLYDIACSIKRLKLRERKALVKYIRYLKREQK